jgi:hypothetical protein
VAGSDARWPFGPTDGTPASRPLVPVLEGVLVAVLRDGDAAEHARQALAARGVADDDLRLYTAEQIVAYDEEFRATRSFTGRVVGAVADDRDAMTRYVEHGRAGRAALWVRVPEREDANRVVRHLADEDTVHIWYHGRDRVEEIPMVPEATAEREPAPPDA